MAGEHDHDHDHDHGARFGMNSLDWLIVAAAVAVAVLAADWIAGTYIREVTAAQAQRFLARVRAGDPGRA